MYHRIGRENKSITDNYILYTHKISPGEKFLPISPSALIVKNFITRIFLSCVIEDMATFTTLVKNYFCNTKVPGLGEIFVKQKFFMYTVLKTGSERIAVQKSV